MVGATVERRKQRIRVMVVDDHQLLREGLRAIFQQGDEFEYVCGVSSCAEALDYLRGHGVDLAVIDITLPDGSGLELTRQITSRLPQLPVLMLSFHDEELYAERAMNAGARGYVMKDSNSEAIVAAMRRILAGEYSLSARVTKRIMSMFSAATNKARGLQSLSNRELEVFQLIGSAASTAQIAATIGIGAKTVETYRLRLKKKFGVESSAELARLAVMYQEGGGMRELKDRTGAFPLRSPRKGGGGLSS